MNKIQVTFKNGDVIMTDDYDELNKDIARGYIESVEFNNKSLGIEVDEALEILKLNATLNDDMTDFGASVISSIMVLEQTISNLKAELYEANGYLSVYKMGPNIMKGVEDK